MKQSVVLRATARRPLDRKITYFTGMEKPVFLPQEATQAQRREIAEATIAAVEAQAGPVSDFARTLYDRYIAGEITLDTAYNLVVHHYQSGEHSRHQSVAASTAA